MISLVALMTALPPFDPHGNRDQMSTSFADVGRGVIAGLAGTCVMTAGLAIEKRVHASRRFIEYDSSRYVVDAASTALRSIVGWQPSTARQRRIVFLGVHWGYGSAIGGTYPVLQKRMSGDLAGVAFFVGCQTMAMTLFPALGHTPAPWRWARSTMSSSLALHALYAATVATTDRLLRRRLVSCRAAAIGVVTDPVT